MDYFSGPVWCSTDPMVVPIACQYKYCKYGCCKMKYVPLQVAFVRTLHKFQGGEVGQDRFIKCMVLNPDASGMEGINPGLFTLL